MFRRRWLCCLNLVYTEVQGRPQQEVIRLSPALRTELLTLVAVAAFAYTDLHADVSSKLYAVDASDCLYAACSADLPQPVLRELFRLLPQKGGWNRLLRPTDALLQTHGCLDPSAAVPGVGVSNVPELAHVVQSSQFKVEAVRRYPKQLHINVGEVASCLLADVCSCLFSFEKQRNTIVKPIYVCRTQRNQL